MGGRPAFGALSDRFGVNSTLAAERLMQVVALAFRGVDPPLATQAA